MLWAAPLLVFAVAHLLSYSGRPEISFFDHTLTATKFAGATLGIELIGVNVANVTMHSYGQRTISHPVAEKPASEGLDAEPAEEDMQPAMDVISVEGPEFLTPSDPNLNDGTPFPMVEPIEATALSEDSESASPDSQTASPDPESALPHSESDSPDSESTSPDSESTSLDSESTSPDSESTSLDSESTSPDPESAPSDSQSDLSADGEFPLLNMIHGHCQYIFTLRPQVAWFTIYPKLLTTLVCCALVGLSIRLTGFHRFIRKAHNDLRSKFRQLTDLILEFLRLPCRVIETLDNMEANDAHNLESTWKYLDMIRGQVLDFEAGQKNDYQDLTKALARLESNMHVVEGRSRKLDTDWETSLDIDGIKQNLVNAYMVLSRWQVVFKNEQAKLSNKFANDLVHDTGVIMLCMERAIKAVQKVLLKEESFATYAQPQNHPNDQELFPMQGPPQLDYDTTSPRTLYSLEKPDPTKKQIEQERAKHAQDELSWTDNQKKANGKNEWIEWEPLRTKIEREEREEKERKENEQKEIERKENESKVNEPAEAEPEKIERKGIERKEIEQKANKPAEAEPKKAAKAKKGAKPKKGPESKESESKNPESERPVID